MRLSLRDFWRLITSERGKELESQLRECYFLREVSWPLPLERVDGLLRRHSGMLQEKASQKCSTPEEQQRLADQAEAELCQVLHELRPDWYPPPRG